jgi:Fungal specific transcription factor domain
MSRIYDLNEQACHIYMARVLAGTHGSALTGLVDKFKDTMDTLAPGSPGEHTLVWPTFIAATESTTPEQQQYFADVLIRHHQRSGFANILAALQHLRRIWSGRMTQDWTKLLPKLQVFIV